MPSSYFENNPSLTIMTSTRNTIQRPKKEQPIRPVTIRHKDSPKSSTQEEPHEPQESTSKAGNQHTESKHIFSPMSKRKSRESVMFRKKDSTSTPTASASEASSSATISADRLKTFKNSLQKFFRETQASCLPLNRIIAYVNRNNKTKFSLSEIESAFARMEDDNQIMVANEIVYLI